MVKLTEVKVEQIVVKGGIRKIFNEDSIEELAASIKKHGVLQPITVQPRPDGTYTLLIGERRLIAAKRVGLDMVPAIVMDETLRPGESLEARLIENLHREGLDPLDEAEAYQQLIDMGYNVSEVARRVGKSRYYVSKRLRLLKLHPKLREEVRRRTFGKNEMGLFDLLEDPTDFWKVLQMKIGNLLSNSSNY
jgi:ParB family chromosome partitioning protein